MFSSSARQTLSYCRWLSWNIFCITEWPDRNACSRVIMGDVFCFPVVWIRGRPINWFGWLFRADRTFSKLLLLAELGSDSCQWLRSLRQSHRVSASPFCMKDMLRQSSSVECHFWLKYLNPLNLPLPLNLKLTNWYRQVTAVWKR